MGSYSMRRPSRIRDQVPRTVVDGEECERKSINLGDIQCFVAVNCVNTMAPTGSAPESCPSTKHGGAAARRHGAHLNSLRIV